MPVLENLLSGSTNILALPSKWIVKGRRAERRSKRTPAGLIDASIGTASIPVRAYGRFKRVNHARGFGNADAKRRAIGQQVFARRLASQLPG